MTNSTGTINEVIANGSFSVKNKMAAKSSMPIEIQILVMLEPVPAVSAA
jgi:hypothetical protein